MSASPARAQRPGPALRETRTQGGVTGAAGTVLRPRQPSEGPGPVCEGLGHQVLDSGGGRGPPGSRTCTRGARHKTSGRKQDFRDSWPGILTPPQARPPESPAGARFQNLGSGTKPASVPRGALPSWWLCPVHQSAGWPRFTTSVPKGDMEVTGTERQAQHLSSPHRMQVFLSVFKPL